MRMSETNAATKKIGLRIAALTGVVLSASVLAAAARHQRGHRRRARLGRVRPRGRWQRFHLLPSGGELTVI